MRKILVALLTLAILFCCAGCRWDAPAEQYADNLGLLQSSKPAEYTFTAPESYHSTVTVAVIENNILRIYLDIERVTLAVECVSTAAQEMYRDKAAEMVGKSLKESVEKIINVAVEEDITPNNVAFDITPNAESGEYYDMIVDCKDGFKDATAGVTSATRPEYKISGEAASTEEIDFIYLPDPNEFLGKAYEFVIPMDGDMIRRLSFTLAEGELAYSDKPYSEVDYGMGESITYGGKTWYEAGGSGGKLKVELAGKELSLSYVEDTVNYIILIGTEDGNLKVVTNNGMFADFGLTTGSVLERVN